MKYPGLLVVTLAAVACGGTTEGPDTSSSGGAGSAGSAGSAGKAGAGGTASQAGASGSGAVGNGGSGGVGNGGSGGTGVDARCPAHKPSGACTAPDLTCEYDPSSGCLCSTAGLPMFGFCTKVDAACTAEVGGASPAPPPDAGTGGVFTRIAVPAHEYCTCTSGAWACRVGI